MFFNFINFMWIIYNFLTNYDIIKNTSKKGEFYEHKKYAIRKTNR